MSKNWSDLRPSPVPPRVKIEIGKPSEARVFNIELYLKKLPKRFSDPRVQEWLALVQKDYDETGNVTEKDFKKMWNMYVGTSPLNRDWLEDNIEEKLNRVYNPMKPR